MTLLPVVERELRVAARRPATHWSRGIAALLGFGILAAFLLTQNGRMREAALAQAVFHTLAFAAFGAAGLTGVFLTADCLSEEKREGTLGLLFLTDLRGVDVVLGKLAGTSLLGIYALLALMPMLALPVMFGGVTFSEFVATSMALLATMMMSLTCGIAASAACLQSRTATAATLALVLIIGGGFVLPIELLDYLAPGSGWGRALRLFSSIHLIISAMSPSMGFASRSAQAFHLSLAIHFMMVVSGLLVASLMLPRRWQESDRSKQLARPSGGLRLPLALGSELGSNAERVLLMLNPFQWLAWRLSGSDVMAKHILRALLMVFVVFWLLGTFSPRSKGAGYVVASVFFAYGIHLLAKIQMALSVVRRLSEDRASGALELILVTPLPLRRIPDGQFAAYKANWRHAMLGISMANIFMLFTVLVGDHFNGRERGIFAGFFIAGLVLSWIDFHAIGRVGIHMALRHNKPQRAALATAARVLLPGMLGIFFGVLMLMAIGGGDDAVTFLHWTWVLVFVCVGMFLVNRGRIGARQELEGIRLGRRPEQPFATASLVAPAVTVAGTGASSPVSS